MKYISVTSPGSDMSVPIFNYFNDYLVSLGEPTTTEGWSGKSVRKHLVKMLHEKPDDVSLYVDSGGFQIIVDYIKTTRIKEYVDVYHSLSDDFCDKIDNIFSLDIYNRNLTDQELYDFNNYSIAKSIELIKNKPQFADKQLFVLQSSNRYSFGNWKKLMNELEVNKYYKKWAVGGLVGLKKDTNAKFSHAVPATLWLLTYQKKYGAVIDQVHWLGQSSRLSFISMSLMEKLYNLNMTSDSSQLVRFAPLEAKLPYMFQNLVTSEFKLIRSPNELFENMINQHSIVNVKHKLQYKEIGHDLSKGVLFKEYSPLEYYTSFNQLHNVDFIECQSQNVYFDMKFAELISDEILKIGIDNISGSDILENMHPIMKQGRLATELFNNILYIRKFKDIINNGDIDAASDVLETIHKQYEYYFETRNRSNNDKELNMITSKLETIKELLDIALFEKEKYNNDLFNLKLDHVDKIHDMIKGYELYFAQTKENLLGIKREITNKKLSDKIFNESLINTHINENVLLYSSMKQKDALIKAKKAVEKHFRVTSVKDLETQYNTIHQEYQKYKTIFNSAPKGTHDAEIEAYNNLKSVIAEHEHSILKLEQALVKLK